MNLRIISLVGVAVLLVGGWWAAKPSRNLHQRPVLETASSQTPQAQPTEPALADEAFPAPAIQHATFTNTLARLRTGEMPQPTAAQLEHYLATNHRNAESLLAVYRLTGNQALLDEATSSFPNDPRVAYTAWFRSRPSAGDPDALKARRQALELLKEAAPQNSLPFYLSAANHFKCGASAQAIQEIQAAAAKPGFNDYVQDEIQGVVELYRSAGYSEAEAALSATSGALLPHLAEMKQAGMSLVELAKSFQTNGEGTSANTTLQMCLELGQRLDDPNSMTLIQQLVGIALKKKAFTAMAESETDPHAIQTLQDQIHGVDLERESIRKLATSQSLETWLSAASEPDLRAYCERRRLFGERQALQWLAARNSGS